MQCESRDGRINLTFRLCDWFRRHGQIYIIDSGGNPVFRQYGPSSCWQAVVGTHKKLMQSRTADQLSVLQEEQMTLNVNASSLPSWSEAGDDSSIERRESGDDSSIESKDDSMLPFIFFRDVEEVHGLHCDLCSLLEEENLFHEGKVYGEVSNQAPFPHLFKDAWFLSSAYAGGTLVNGARIQRIDDGNEFCTVGKDIHWLEERFEPLFEKFRMQGYNIGMMTLRKSQRGRKVTCFKPHKDKLGGGVVFVCLSEYFWVILAINNGEDDTRLFMEWKDGLQGDEAKQVDKLLKCSEFNKQARSIYKCSPGTALAFAADEIVHATVVPKSFGQRQLCILTAANEIVTGFPNN